ncbi:MAG TPA: hypothetical protein VLB01_07985 [Thermodesulfobacteriota bacterium]|nr:hypothetical protein [Thermodesulfobacteriota bacterium]
MSIPSIAEETINKRFYSRLTGIKIHIYILLLASFFTFANAWADLINESKILSLTASGDFSGLREIGPDVLPILARLYESSNDENQRINIAHAFYQLGWKSSDAKQALMKDIHTRNQTLRISVQYALGRVSNDDEVVEALLDNMQDDTNPLFRDKAACALAYDQIHLTEEQKVRLYKGLINALSDQKRQVRSIAIKALKIHTGQTKGFNPSGPLPEREGKIREWKEWLEEYKSNL